MTEIKLEPKEVFRCFAEVNKVPRPSKKEEKMIAFLSSYGEGLGLETHVDETGNVLIRKPASPGYENRETTIIQSHMDMVCEKEAGVDFDFEHDAIRTEVVGEWLTAKGTTLGADDGIGVAMAMALLADNSLEHGPIECVFTRDEETQLSGASGMKAGFMTGKYLINLDSEDEGVLFISCAGGASTLAEFDITTEQPGDDMFFFKVGIKGLTGGHSGDDIEKKRANANKPDCASRTFRAAASTTPSPATAGPSPRSMPSIRRTCAPTSMSTSRRLRRNTTSRRNPSRCISRAPTALR